MFSLGTPEVFTHKRNLMFNKSPLTVYNSLVDINKYKDFLPWITASHVKKSAADYLVADMTIGFPPITQSYASHVYCVKPSSILSKSDSSFVFEMLESHWELFPDPASLKAEGSVVEVKGCEAHYSIKFKFTSVFYQQFTSLVFDTVCTKTAESFQRRINSLTDNQPTKYDKALKAFILA
jgi:coenzyme Q-binding protein COQ10